MADEKFKYALFAQGAINADRLHEELKAALGEPYHSVDTGVQVPDAAGNTSGPFIMVRIWKEQADDKQLGQIEAVLKTHDPAQLSTRQQKEKDRIDAFVRLRNADFKALRGLAAVPAAKVVKAEVVETPVTRAEHEALKAQMAKVIDLLEDWQKLMETPGG